MRPTVVGFPTAIIIIRVVIIKVVAMVAVVMNSMHVVHVIKLLRLGGRWGMHLRAIHGRLAVRNGLASHRTGIRMGVGGACNGARRRVCHRSRNRRRRVYIHGNGALVPVTDHRVRGIGEVCGV
jgi:hypothetical protein